MLPECFTSNFISVYSSSACCDPSSRGQSSFGGSASFLNDIGDGGCCDDYTICCSRCKIGDCSRANLIIGVVAVEMRCIFVKFDLFGC